MNRAGAPSCARRRPAWAPGCKFSSDRWMGKAAGGVSPASYSSAPEICKPSGRRELTWSARARRSSNRAPSVQQRAEGRSQRSQRSGGVAAARRRRMASLRRAGAGYGADRLRDSNIRNARSWRQCGRQAGHPARCPSTAWASFAASSSSRYSHSRSMTSRHSIRVVPPRAVAVSGRGYALLNSAPCPEVPLPMTARARNISILVALGFVAFLLWSTLSSQRAECAVAVEYQGRQGSGHGLGRLGGGCAAGGADRRLRPAQRVDERPGRLQPGPADQSSLPDAVSAGAAVSPRRLRFPHPLILLVLCVLVAAVLTWLLPGGRVRAAAGSGRGARGRSRRHLSSGPREPGGPVPGGRSHPQGDGRRRLGHLLRVPRRRRVRRRGADGGPGAPREPAGAAALGPGASGSSRSSGFAFAWGGILIQMQEELIAFVPGAPAAHQPASGSTRSPRWR